MSQSPIHLVVVGRGKMAHLIADNCEKGTAGPITCSLVEKMPYLEIIPENAVVVYVSSPTHLEATIKMCEERNLPLIQASSGLQLPAEVSVPVIDAPNLALPIVALFDVLPRLGRLLQGMGVSVKVIESHQASKKSMAISAKKMAGCFGADETAVSSIRDPDIQAALLGVPKEHLDGHAYHVIDLEVSGVNIGLFTAIGGRMPYFYGLVAVARKLIENKSMIVPGIHSVDRFMFGDIK